jgi:hypothetical protein
LALDYLGLSRELGVIASAAVIIAAAGTGDFRRFEQFSLLLVFGSLLLVPIVVWVHPPVGQIAHDFVVPQIPAHGKLSEIMLLIIAIETVRLATPVALRTIPSAKRILSGCQTGGGNGAPIPRRRRGGRPGI